jgi:hypothetical protein
VADLTQFKIRTGDVVFEAFEDEIVLIHLGNGNYYSLQGSAREIWGLLEQGRSLPAIVAELARRYLGRPEAFGPAVARFLAELVRDELIETVALPADALADAEPVLEPDVAVAEAARPAFAEPVLSRYTDMQELLLLDPIHDIREQPQARPAGAAAPATPAGETT